MRTSTPLEAKMSKRQATIYKHRALGPTAYFVESRVAPVKPTQAHEKTSSARFFR